MGKSRCSVPRRFGLGSAGGFKFMVEDRGGMGVRSLEEQMENLVDRFKRLAWLKLTDDSLAKRAQDKVPDEILTKLEPLKNQTLYWTDFERAISKALTRDEKGKHLTAILNRVEKAPVLGRRENAIPVPYPADLSGSGPDEAPRHSACLVQDLNQTLSM